MKLFDFGEVELLEMMGNDKSIVDAARVSYKGTKKQNDWSLLRYLMRHKHNSCFEMCELKFRIKAPMFVANQFVRHRTASANFQSFRYTVPEEHFYVPEPSRVATQAIDNKQGSGEVMSEGERISKAISWAESQAFMCYDTLIEDDVARELARTVLPMGVYTEWIWKVNLRNLLHFLELRLDAHAQYEIRVYAEAIRDIVKQYYPRTWQAFEDYVLNAVTLNALDLEIIRNLPHDDYYPLDKEDIIRLYANIDLRWTKGDIQESKERLGKLGLL